MTTGRALAIAAQAVGAVVVVIGVGMVHVAAGLIVGGLLVIAIAYVTEATLEGGSPVRPQEPGDNT